MAKSGYEYPLDPSWSVTELTQVINFFAQIEQAYEESANAQNVLLTYQNFQNIIKNASVEKYYEREFAKASGYDVYAVVKKAKEQQNGRLTMEHA